jgi:moderate conductance mechanosensitive channel
MLPQDLAQQDTRISRILERDWHDDIVEFLRHDLPKLIVILFFAFVLLRLVRFFVNRMNRVADRQVGNSQRASQLRTMASILRGTSYFVVGFMCLLQILPLFNIDLKPLLASAGVIGLGISFGAQSIFKDMLTGVFILLEDQFNVGDVVKIAGLQGSVESMTLRCTTLRDGDGTVYVIPNSQIATVSNLSKDYSVATLTISVDASANPDKVITLLKQIAGEVRIDSAFKDVAISDPDIPGVDKISGREVLYPINLRVRANQRDGVLRELRRRIILAFDKQGIPFGNSSSTLIMQRSDPTAPPVSSPLGG